jgi:Dehydrogenases (flavoproteins)
VLYAALVLVRSSLTKLWFTTGPAGLAAAIRLKQLANEAGNEEFRVILLEKAGELGAHIVSGNVLQPTALDELLPDWLSEDNPSRFEGATPAKGEKMRFLTKNGSYPLPMPPQMHNDGNYIVSLNELTKWLGGACGRGWCGGVSWLRSQRDGL